MTTEIQEYSQTEAALSVLREKYTGATFEVDTTDGMKSAKEARADVRSYRTGLEKKRKEIKTPALERSRLIDAEAQRITVELVGLEKPIDRQIKVHEEKIEAERQEKIDTEAKRVEDIKGRILCIREHATVAFHVGITVKNREQEIVDLEAIEIDETFAEFQEQAADAKGATLATLRESLTAAIKREAEEKKIVEERAELDKLRAEVDDREAKANEERAESDRKAREKREAEEKAERNKLENQRKEQEKKQAEIDKENKRLVDAKVKREAQAKAERKRKTKAVADAKKAEFPGTPAIIKALCEHFDVTETVVKKWLKVLK
jgi:chromosome segregation ATPase